MPKKFNEIGTPQPQILPVIGFVTLAAIFLLRGSSAFGQLTLSFAPEYYYWQENANGAKLLDESGIRYGLELSYKQQAGEGWIWAGRLKVYYGSLDYTAYPPGGTIKTSSEYFGGLAELRTGYRWDLNGDQYLDLMGGLGLEDWRRSLNGPGSYAENWLPPFISKPDLNCARKTKVAGLEPWASKFPSILGKRWI